MDFIVEDSTLGTSVPELSTVIHIGNVTPIHGDPYPIPVCLLTPHITYQLLRNHVPSLFSAATARFHESIPIHIR